MKLHTIFLLALLAGCAVKSPAIERDRMDGQWQVMTETAPKGGLLCYAISSPVESHGTIHARGKPYLMVTRRNSGRIEVSAMAGYPYMRASKVELVVNDEPHTLFFEDNVAWARNDAEDKAIIAAMKDAEHIELRAVSQDRLTSIDDYSAQGFTAAITRIRDLSVTIQPEVTVEQRAETPGGDGRLNLIGLSREELAEALRNIGAEKFRAKQVWQWMYGQGVDDFSKMTTIAKPQQKKFAEHFVIERPAIDRALVSSDGTRKWLLKFSDGNKVESVHIPEEDRGALCVSSQVGCTLACTFCHTGTMKLVRNLTAGEIVGQVMVARDGLGEWPAPLDGRLLSNIVMMGMGEPLYNYDQVKKALTIIMDPEGIAISKRRITLSTSGVIPKIEQTGRELGVNLAISLHAVRDDLRNELVPINKKYPIAPLLEACRNYPAATNARRITFEYVMLKGVNDTDADAHELVRLLKDIHAKVNLIPFNPWPGAPYECSSNNRIHRFAEILNAAGYSSPVRTPRGRDIFAACGQLKSDSERKKGEKVKLH